MKWTPPFPWECIWPGRSRPMYSHRDSFDEAPHISCLDSCGISCRGDQPLLRPGAGWPRATDLRLIEASARHSAETRTRHQWPSHAGRRLRRGIRQRIGASHLASRGSPAACGIPARHHAFRRKIHALWNRIRSWSVGPSQGRWSRSPCAKLDRSDCRGGKS